MKRQIRTGVFETNSSSTHTLTICTKKEFEDWTNGKLRLDKWTDKFIPNKAGNISIYNTESYEEWCNDGYLETFMNSYTTEHGDEIVVFGKYGYDG